MKRIFWHIIAWFISRPIKRATYRARVKRSLRKYRNLRNAGLM